MVRFTITMRGYDIAEVDGLVSRAERAAASDDAGLRAAACRDLRTARLRECLRGYSRRQVDQAIDQLARELTTTPPA
jgi:DivIVA domain-containing protein